MSTAFPLDEMAPDYAGGWLGDVLPGALTALGVPGLVDPLDLASWLPGVERIVVLLLDGLGWHQLGLGREQAPALTALAATGRPITCGFPSTTPTSLISLGTGAKSGEHGVLAFTTLVPGTDEVLVHITWRDDPDPVVWQPVTPLLDRVRSAGLGTAVVNSPLFEATGLTRRSTGNLGYIGATGADEMVAGVATALRSGARCVYAYLPDVDRAAHEHGAGSPEWRQAMSDVDKAVARLQEELPTGSALIVTADHGHLISPWDRRIDLDSVPQLTTGVRAVAGEPRVRYLYTEPGARADVLAAWRDLAGHAAWIGVREEAIATGWYGPVPPSHAERIGDIVVVCREDWSIQASAHEPARVLELVGLHGARTRTEMEIPLLVHSTF
ncbi:nucleotide pyrophosphatase/phosphodiesterase family protein [Hamadaea sp.]|uniref:alkaline phosphatase family protein n=1 Tax=Hamadaea sp. TaxID=2024425 RepID=UPI0025C43D3B|nr:nucleotide pyrophosphatase/phosphodiesterase family protein [Hamadaea sp.]